MLLSARFWGYFCGSCCFVLLLSATSLAQSSGDLHFVENCGQWDEKVIFAQCGQDVPWSVEREGLSFLWQRPLSESEAEGVCVRLAFEESRDGFSVVPFDQETSRFSFFHGRDAKGWQRGLPGWRRLRLIGVWQDIDVAISERDGRLAYDLHLGPGADLSDVIFRCEGVEALWVDAGGALVMDTALGPIHQSPPKSWIVGPGGELRDVSSEFRLLGQMRYGFAIDAEDYPEGWALVIDPGLKWSTLLGTPQTEYVYDVGVDAAGNSFVTGSTNDRRFPTTPGAYSTTYRGGECFLTKFDPTGSRLVYSTYLGGSGFEEGRSLDIRPDGTALLAGATYSADFPLSPNAFQTVFQGGLFDAFVSVLSPQGDHLAYSTYLGGAIGGETPRDVAFHDPLVLIGGVTSSPDFPVTPNGWDRSYNDLGTFYLGDGFLAAVDLRFGSLVYSSFLGGRSLDWINAIEALSSRDVLVIGSTESSDFPTTPAAFDRTYYGGIDGFAARLDLATGQLAYSTKLGGNPSPCCASGSFAVSLAVASSGDAIVGGWTNASGFPVTTGAYDTQFDGGDFQGKDAFLLALDPSGSQLLWSTFLGGTADDEITGLRIDPRGDLVVSGSTRSTDFPEIGRTAGFGGEWDAFVARLDGGGSSLKFSTLIGGTGPEESTGVALDDQGSATVTGYTMSRDFPTTEGAYDGRWDAFRDVFVTHLRTGPVLQLQGNPMSGSSVHFEIEGAAPIETGQSVQLTVSSTGTGGIPLPGGLSLPLTFDAWTAFSLAMPAWFQGVVDPAGSAALGNFTVPPIPTGTRLWAAGFLWSPSSGSISVVTDPLEILVQ